MVSVNPGVSVAVAREIGKDPIMDLVAAQIKAAVEIGAARHRKTGAFAGSISVKKAPGKSGVQDRLVIADDPVGAAKELGHVTPSGRHVPGLFVMANVARNFRQ